MNDTVSGLALLIHLKLQSHFVLSKVNRMVSWMVRNIISREANVLKIYKFLIRPHIAYYTQAWASVFRYGNGSVILGLMGIQK